MRCFLIIVALFFVDLAGAQTDPNVRPWAFFVDNEVVDKKIQIFNESENVFGTISFDVSPAVHSNFLTLTTNFAVIDGQTTLYSVDGPEFHKHSDFYNDSYLSSSKSYSFTIPASVVSNIFSNHPNAKFIIRYRYKVLGNAQWFPQSGGYYRGDSNQEYGFQYIAPFPIITGASSICNEATYTITNQQTVSLENANGIATLQNLGGGQYKLTKIGNGEVNLKAVNGTSVTNKKIVVGTITYTMTGPTNVNAYKGVLIKQEYFSVNSPKAGTTYLW